MITDSVPHYITDLITKIAEVENFVNYSLSSECGSNCDGFQSLILKFVISGMRNKRNDKLSLICKVPSSNVTRRREFHSDIAFDQELYFYENVFPYFASFQRERGVNDDDDGFFAFPKCYGTIRDKKLLGDHAVVMENLQEKGFTMWNKSNDIDFGHTALVMKELGKLHAVSFAIRDQEPEMFKKFMQRTSNFHGEIDKSPAAQRIQKCHYDRAIRSLDPNETVLIERMENLKSTYGDLLKATTSNTTCEPFGVLVHGDCWINNILFRYDDGPSTPSKLCLIDWQLSQFGSPALDISSFLFCTLSPKLRNDHFDDFINCYYKAFQRTLTKLGSDAQKLFTYDNLQDQLRRFSIYAMYVAPIIIGIVTSDQNNVPDVDEVVRRIEILTKDPTADVNLDEFFEENDSYRHRMSSMIRDMVRMEFW